VLGEGIGRKRIEELMTMYPNILETQKGMTQKGRKKIVLSVPGFADLTATTVARNLPWAATFAEVFGMITTFKERKLPATVGPLVGYTVIISGTLSQGGQRYTRQQAKEAVEAAGGKFAERIVKPKEGLRQIAVIIGGGTKKETDAKKYGVPVYGNDQFFEMLETGLK
jgi:NAD-dependent DNA ligase